jgi:AraC-like DNA-binding protein
MHAHAVFEFVYILSGKGERGNATESTPVSAGDVYIIRPGEMHGGRADARDPFHIFTIALDPARLATGDVGLALAEATALDDGRKLLDQRLIHGCAGAEQPLRRILEELDQAERLERRRSLTAVMVQALAIEFLVHITRCAIAGQQSPQSNRANNSIRAEFQELLGWIQGRLSDPPSLAQMAARVDLSPAHFTVAFKRQVGQTPLEYVTSQRIDEAARLLRDRRRDTITAIALDLGFSSSQYFSLVFRKIKGCTPRSWRNRGG